LSQFIDELESTAFEAKVKTRSEDFKAKANTFYSRSVLDDEDSIPCSQWLNYS